MKNKEIKSLLISVIDSIPESVALFDTELNLLFQSQYLNETNFNLFLRDLENKKSSVFGELKTAKDQQLDYILKPDSKTLNINIYLKNLKIENQNLDYIYVKVSEVTVLDHAVAAAEDEKTQLNRISLDRLTGLAEISAGISHEINNPLTIIVAKIQYIKNLLAPDLVNKEKIFENLEKICHHSDRITRIVKSLKSFSRDSANDNLVSVVVKELVEDSTQLLMEQIKNNCIQVEMTFKSNHLFAKCRTSEIMQIIVNLLKNSIDALAEVRQPMIRIHAEQVDVKKIKIYFTDNGSGIPIDQRSKIFKSFYTTKAAGHGTGLGLSLSKHLAQKNNGDLYLDEASPETCFCLELCC